MKVFLAVAAVLSTALAGTGGATEPRAGMPIVEATATPTPTPTPEPAPTTADCPKGLGHLRLLDGLRIWTDGSIGSDEVCVLNPLFGKGLTKTKLCWLDPDGTGSSCEANTRARPSFEVAGFSKKKEGTTEIQERYPIGPGLQAAISTYRVLIVRFHAWSRTADVREVLRFEWETKDESGNTEPRDQSYTIEGVRVKPDGRFRMQALAGFSLMHSRNSFSEAFPELLIDAQTRFVEHCRNAQNPEARCSPEKTRRLVRGYARGGLTSSSAGVADAIGADPLQSFGFSGTKSFEGTVGVGVGWSFAINSMPEDTNRLSVLAMGRLATMSLEKSNALKDALPNNWFAGVRVENEAGRFAGAHIEAGAGASHQFVAKPKWRLRVDAFLPINDSSLAIRLSVDEPWMAGDDEPEELLEVADGKETGKVRGYKAGLRYEHPCLNADRQRQAFARGSMDLEGCRAGVRELIQAGEIKISFIYRVNLGRLFGR